MTAPLPKEKITEIRVLWAKGRKRKHIAKLCGVTERSVSKYCSDIPKPFEWRGRRNSKFLAKDEEYS